MRTVTPRLLLFPLLLFVVACDQQAMFDKLVPKEEAAFAKAHLELYVARDAETIMSQLDPRLVDASFPHALTPIFDVVPAEEPTEILLVGSHTSINSDEWRATLTYQLEFSDRWLLAAIALQRTEGASLAVTGVNFQPMEQSLQDANAFHASGNGVVGWIVLACTVLIPLFCIGTFVTCLRTPMATRKWRWAVFTLVGAGTISFNWTTGQLGYSVLSVQLFGAGIAKAGPYAPWILSFAFPVGAIAFLARRGTLISRAKLDDTQQGAADEQS